MHVHRAGVVPDGLPDPEQVRGLGHVVRAAARPDEDVIREVPDDAVRLLLRRRHRPREVGDVLVVPRVPVRDGRPVRDARDLVPVVPPRHHARVLGGVIPEPVVRLDVVLDDDRPPVVELALEHHAGLGHPPRHVVRVLPKPLQPTREHQHRGHEHRRAPATNRGRAPRGAKRLRHVRVQKPRQGGRGGLPPPGPPTGSAPRRRARRLLLVVPLVPLVVPLVPLVLVLAVLEPLRPRELPVRGGEDIVQGVPDGDPREARRDRAEEDDEAHHAVGEVVRDGGVEREEERRGGSLVGEEVRDGDAEPDRGDVEGVVQVPEVRVRASGLVLGDGVHERVARLRVLDEQAPDPDGERAEPPRRREAQRERKDAPRARRVDAQTNPPRLRTGLLRSLHQKFRERQRLVPQEHAHGPELLGGLDRGEADDGELDRAERADDPEERVRLVRARVELADQHDDRRVKTDHVQDEHVPAPRGDHVDVAQAGEGADGPGPPRAQRADPREEREAHGGDGEGLVVVSAADGAHGVRGDDAHDQRRDDRGRAAAAALGGEERDEERRDGAEPRGEEDADVVQAHPVRIAERAQGAPDAHGRDLHAGVDGRPDGAAERVPAHVVEPRAELRPAVVRQVLRRAEVEPRVELVDDPPVLLDRVEANVVRQEAREREAGEARARAQVRRQGVDVRATHRDGTRGRGAAIGGDRKPRAAHLPIERDRCRDLQAAAWHLTSRLAASLESERGIDGIDGLTDGAPVDFETPRRCPSPD